MSYQMPYMTLSSFLHNKSPLFTPKNSDALLVVDQVFLILCIFIVKKSKKPSFNKNSLTTPIFFTLFKLSRPSHNTTSQNIGGTNAYGPSPTSVFLGTVPQSPLGLRP